MDWTIITAACAFCCLMGAVFIFSTRSIVREEISKLSEIYVRQDLHSVQFKQIEGHFDFLRDQRSNDLKAIHGRFKS